jgi:chromosome segregation ATPase
MEDLNKDQLHEAYQLAKSMGNAFRAFKHTEEFILQVVQLKASFDSYAGQVEQRKAEAAAAKAGTADLVSKLGVVRAELDQEVVRLAEYRKGELAKIQAEISDVKKTADDAMEAYREAIAKMAAELEQAKRVQEENLASLDAEIAAKQDVLTKLQAEIDVLKQKFS